MRASWLKKEFILRFPERFRSEQGVSLIELTIALGLMTVAIGAITGVLIMSFRQQNEVNADFRSQLDVHQALYDLEKQIAEAKRADNDGNTPIFTADAVAIPVQTGGWTVYEYAVPYGETENTILRKNVASKPDALPVAPVAGDKALINTGDVEMATTDERLSIGQPIFTYYANDGSELPAPVVNTRDVHAVRVSFMVTVTKASAVRESTVSTVQINLRNY